MDNKDLPAITLEKTPRACVSSTHFISKPLFLQKIKDGIIFLVNTCTYYLEQTLQMIDIFE